MRIPTGLSGQIKCTQEATDTWELRVIRMSHHFPNPNKFPSTSTIRVKDLLLGTHKKPAPYTLTRALDAARLERIAKVSCVILQTREIRKRMGLDFGYQHLFLCFRI